MKGLQMPQGTILKTVLPQRGLVRFDFTHMAQREKGHTFHYLDFAKKPEFALDIRTTALYELIKEGKSDQLKDGKVVMLGWRSLPINVSNKELASTQAAARQFASGIDAYVSLGIGGSYLGIEAVVKAIRGSLDLYNMLPREVRGGPEIYFMGNHMDPTETARLLEHLSGKRVGINVISKSGTTTETALAFRVLRNAFEGSYGTDASKFIVATTDANKGSLKKLADEKGYSQYVVPDDIGGRYSVTSAVGLFGIAVAGIDIMEFIAGAREAEEQVRQNPFDTNISMLRAAFRFFAYAHWGKKIEVAASGVKSLDQVLFWMQQLGPETEGKEGKGLWIAPERYSEMAHANGQLIQQGERNLIETFLAVENQPLDVIIPDDPKDIDGMNYVAGKGLSLVNRQVVEGLRLAHFLGGVPSMSYIFPSVNEYTLGQFMQYEMNAIALSALLLGLNPFNQPGVQEYKDIMFARLGKPGTEKQAEEFKAVEATLPRRMV